VTLRAPVTACRSLQDFRDSKTSMILLTAALARGMDLPNVSHVYNLGAPASSAEYVHRAGRAGRVGAATAGTVTTIVDSQEELEKLQAMVAELGLEARAVGVVGGEAAAAGSLDGAQEETDFARKALEDLYYLGPEGESVDAE
jgi:superfamily II DNA/RNA helicase